MSVGTLITPTRLAEVLDAHRQWVTAAGAQGHRADLRGVDLRGVDLRDVTLRDADLRDADLRGADLRGADLRGVDLRDANLRGADLSGADLRGADLEIARLPEGWGWWQGGRYGPNHRSVRVLGDPDGNITVYAGCISGPPDSVIASVAETRLPEWAQTLGREAADLEFDDFVELVDLGVRSVRRQTAVTVSETVDTPYLVSDERYEELAVLKVVADAVDPSDIHMGGRLEPQSLLDAIEDLLADHRTRSGRRP